MAKSKDPFAQQVYAEKKNEEISGLTDQLPYKIATQLANY